jgi:hypothetical protein
MSAEERFGMDGCPLKVKNPEFKFHHHETASNFTVEFGVGYDDYKYDCESYIDVDTSNGGGYDLEVAVRIEGEWQVVSSTGVRIKIPGQFEKNAFKYAIQKAGLLTLPVYGTIKTDEELWKEQNAIREQT